jgi:hypothetical protein
MARGSCGVTCLLVVLLAVAGLRPARAQSETALPDAPADDARDDCTEKGGVNGAELDRLRASVYSGVCASARWFDSLFGEPREYVERDDQTYGRIGAALTYGPLDRLRLDGHFRANFALPALDERFNAVVGRETTEAFVTDSYDESNFLPGSFSDEPGADWYAGLNYGAVKGTNSRFDIGAGVQVSAPVNPYLKARYQYVLRPGGSLQLTSRATTFWQNQQGFGVTLALDSDLSLGERTLLRWANTVTRSEVTAGVRWKTRLALYQELNARSAIRYEGGLRGETGGIQPDLKGLRVTYRRSVWRQWFFLETSAGVFWTRAQPPKRTCEGCAEVALGFDMMFGDRYDRPRDRIGPTG